MTKLKTLLYSSVLSAIAFVGCKTDEEVVPFVNTNLTDTTGINVPIDLFASGKLDGVDFEFFNGRNKILNQQQTYENGFCDSVGIFPSYVQVQTTVFHDPSVRTNALYIEIVECITVDTLYDEKFDNILRTRSMPILNLSDSAVGAQIKYYDEDGVLWSSGLGDNTGPGNNFIISGIIENNLDSISKHYIFGEFSCDLYNIEGESKKLRRGSFKGRIGARP